MFFPKTKKGSKYRNHRVKYNGITFDSKAELNYYQGVLIPRLKAGEITDIKVHPRYDLHVDNIKICAVVFDFEYFDTKQGCFVIDDVKGFDNEKSRRKRKHFEVQYGRKVNIINIRGSHA